MVNTARDILWHIETPESSETFEMTQIAFDIINESEELKEQFIKFKSALVLLTYQKSINNNLDLENFLERLDKVFSWEEQHTFLSSWISLESWLDKTILDLANNLRPTESIEEKANWIATPWLEDELDTIAKESWYMLPVNVTQRQSTEKLEEIIRDFCDEKWPFRQELANRYVRFSQWAWEKAARVEVEKVWNNVFKWPFWKNK